MYEKLLLVYCKYDEFICLGVDAWVFEVSESVRPGFPKASEVSVGKGGRGARGWWVKP